MNLTSRNKKIIFILLEESDYITNQNIAEQIGISSRTVIREMNIVEEWLGNKNIILERKKGKGIKIIAEHDNRLNLKKILIGEKEEALFSPELRQMRLKYELLLTLEPRKIYSFSEIFNVTEGTVSNDFEYIESWFKNYELRLIRKQGLGVYIEGSEINIRRAMVALIYENIPQLELMNLVKNMHLNKPIDIETYENDDKVFLRNLMDVKHFAWIKRLLKYIEENMGYQFADYAFIALIIRFSVTLKRIGQGNNLFITDYKHEQVVSKEYMIINSWLDVDTTFSNMRITKDEIYYLAMHVKGTKRREVSQNNQISIIEEFRLIKIAKKMIHIAQIQTGAYLEDNHRLLIGLVRHLGPAINKMHLNLDIINPLLEDIKTYYPKLFQATKQCVKVIEEEENITVVEDEIAYIATHIGAAMKKDKRKINKKFQVAVACANGIGASRFLCSEIESEFNNIDIVAVLSTLDLDESKLKKLNVDVIITTVPIANISFPLISVNTILTNEDKQKIKTFIDMYIPSPRVVLKKSNKTLKEKLKKLNQYSLSIMNVLDNFILVENLDSKNMNELIEAVSESIVHTDDKRVQLVQDFKNREEKGSTLLAQKNMMLLHCRSISVDEIFFMVIRLKESMMLKSNPANANEISTIAVMVAPIEIEGVELDVLSEISRSIITSNFANALKESDDKELQQKLELILEVFYQEKALDLAGL